MYEICNRYNFYIIETMVIYNLFPSITILKQVVCLTHLHKRQFLGKFQMLIMPVPLIDTYLNLQL